MHVYAMWRHPPCVYVWCMNSDSSWYSIWPGLAYLITSECAMEETCVLDRRVDLHAIDATPAR